MTPEEARIAQELHALEFMNKSLMSGNKSLSLIITGMREAIRPLIKKDYPLPSQQEWEHLIKMTFGKDGEK